MNKDNLYKFNVASTQSSFTEPHKTGCAELTSATVNKKKRRKREMGGGRREGDGHEGSTRLEKEQETYFPTVLL